MKKKLTWADMSAYTIYLVTVALAVALMGGLSNCGAIKATHTINVTPATRALILAQPEFAEVDCGDARTTVVGADVAKDSLILSINCVGF